jgi:hypothetical protein
MPFWKKKEAKQTFSDLVRGLQYSVNTAMEMLEARNLELLSRYFTEEGDPRVRRLNIDENTAIDVPIISIVSPSALAVKEMEMEFAVQINNVELREKMPQHGFLAGEKHEDLKISTDRSDLQIDFSGTTDKTTTMKIKIKFESAPMAEGMAKTVEEFTRGVEPFERVDVELSEEDQNI